MSTSSPEQIRARRIETLGLVNDEYPHQDVWEELVADTEDHFPRYALVEQNSHDDYNLSLHDSASEATNYWKGSSPDEWSPLLLVDLDTGAAWYGEIIYGVEFDRRHEDGFSSLNRALNTPEAQRLLNSAAALISDNGENPEYDRGQVELIAEALGLSSGAHPEILNRLLKTREEQA